MDNMARLAKELPDMHKGFMEFMQGCYKAGALSVKQKELSAVSVSIAIKCAPCVEMHAKNALSAAASQNEVLEAAAVGTAFGGAPSVVFLLDNIIKALA